MITTKCVPSTTPTADPFHKDKAEEFIEDYILQLQTSAISLFEEEFGGAEHEYSKTEVEQSTFATKGFVNLFAYFVV